MCDKDTCNNASCCGECEPWNCLEQQINDALATKEEQLQGYVGEAKDAAAESKASAEASAQSAQSAAESKEFRDEAETAANTAVAAEGVVLGVANTLQYTADKLEQVADELGTAIAGVAVSSWFYTTVSENQTVIPVPANKNAVDVQSIYIEGGRQSPFRGFEFDKTAMIITLAEPLPLGLEIEIILGTYNSDNPNDFAHTLASTNGASLVGTSLGNTVQEILNSHSGSFQTGVKLLSSNDLIVDKSVTPNQLYRWDGAFPKLVDAGSTPSTTGGIGLGAWLSVGDAVLRSELASENGFSLIGVGQTTLDKNIFWGTPEQYGGGLGGDDTLAMATCLANHRLMILGEKTYNASSVEVGPDNSVWGLGKTKSIIKASANPGFFFSVKGVSGVGYSGEISGICVDGNRIVDWTGYFGGDSTATVSKASIRNCAFRNGVKANVVLDATQNSLFQDLDVANDVDFEGLRGVYLVNGAGNNMLLSLECSGGSLGSIVTGRDSGFPCWGLNAFSRANANNTFSRCIGESISENAVLVNRKRSVLLEYANSNTFTECDLVSHGTYSECAVKITDTCSYNTFDNVSFGNNPSSSIPAMINEGFNTRVLGGNMDGFGPIEITTTQGIMVRDCRNLAAGYVKVQNLAGNTNANIQGTVFYSDTSGNDLPPFNNPNQIVTDGDGRYWATRGNSFTESVQFFTGYQRTFNQALTISGESGNVGLQLPGFGVFEVEFAVKDGADGSHRAVGGIRVVFHVGVQSLTSATIVSPLVATDGQFNTLAASVDSSGFLTIAINTSSVTSAFARINVRMVNDIGF